MKIIDGYDGCTKEEILAMPEDELRQAVIRVFSIPCREFTDDKGWFWRCNLPDEIADAFMGREVDLAGPVKKQEQLFDENKLREWLRKNLCITVDQVDFSSENARIGIGFMHEQRPFTSEMIFISDCDGRDK